MPLALCVGAGNWEDAMTGFIFSRLAMVATVTVILAVQAMAQAAVDRTPKRTIVVSLEDRKLALLEGGQVKKVYTVAVGKPSTPSPTGTFVIERRVMNPTYSHNGKIVPPGPGNPVGTRWMGLSLHGYGIHGTNEPRSIGKPASHGCIRLARPDLEELYAQVSVGDTVVLVGQRNEQTAALFGNGKSVTPAAAQPVLTAQNPPAPPSASTASGTGNAATTAMLAQLSGSVAGTR
jgi:L,D-transpeptidase-like protein